MVICKNCNTKFEDYHNYCPHCGAKHIRNRLKPSVLVQQINEQFISIDNKFLQTFLNLFKKPEDVINGYIAGTRRKYIDVLQYIAIALTLVGIQVFLMNTFFKEELESSFKLLESLDGNLQTAENAKNNPFKFEVESFQQVNQYQSVIYIITIPFYALASWVANFIIRPKWAFNFTEHLVVNIYYYGQVIIITALLSILFLCFGLNYLLISGLVSLLVFAYHFYTLKRVFALDIWNAIAFYMLIMVGFFMLGIVISILAYGIGYFAGHFF